MTEVITPATLKQEFTAAQVSQLRARVYGIRIADDPAHPAAFAVICPRHRVVACNLNLIEARSKLAEHIETHA